MTFNQTSIPKRFSHFVKRGLSTQLNNSVIEAKADNAAVAVAVQQANAAAITVEEQNHENMTRALGRLQGQDDSNWIMFMNICQPLKIPIEFVIRQQEAETKAVVAKFFKNCAEALKEKGSDRFFYIVQSVLNGDPRDPIKFLISSEKSFLTDADLQSSGLQRMVKLGLTNYPNNYLLQVNDVTVTCIGKGEDQDDKDFVKSALASISMHHVRPTPRGINDTVIDDFDFFLSNVTKGESENNLKNEHVVKNDNKLTFNFDDRLYPFCMDFSADMVKMFSEENLREEVKKALQDFITPIFSSGEFGSQICVSDGGFPTQWSTVRCVKPLSFENRSIISFLSNDLFLSSDKDILSKTRSEVRAFNKFLGTSEYSLYESLEKWSLEKFSKFSVVKRNIKLFFNNFPDLKLIGRLKDQHSLLRLANIAYSYERGKEVEKERYHNILLKMDSVPLPRKDDHAKDFLRILHDTLLVPALVSYDAIILDGAFEQFLDLAKNADAITIDWFSRMMKGSETKLIESNPILFIKQFLEIMKAVDKIKKANPSFSLPSLEGVSDEDFTLNVGNISKIFNVIKNTNPLLSRQQRELVIQIPDLDEPLRDALQNSPSERFQILDKRMLLNIHDPVSKVVSLLVSSVKSIDAINNAAEAFEQNPGRRKLYLSVEKEPSDIFTEKALGDAMKEFHNIKNDESVKLQVIKAAYCRYLSVNPFNALKSNKKTHYTFKSLMEEYEGRGFNKSSDAINFINCKLDEIGFFQSKSAMKSVHMDCFGVLTTAHLIFNHQFSDESDKKEQSSDKEGKSSDSNKPSEEESLEILMNRYKQMATFYGEGSEDTKNAKEKLIRRENKLRQEIGAENSSNVLSLEDDYKKVIEFYNHFIDGKDFDDNSGLAQELSGQRILEISQKISVLAKKAVREKAPEELYRLQLAFLAIAMVAELKKGSGRSLRREQLMAVILGLKDNRLFEIDTGEGKTLAIEMMAMVQAATTGKVDILVHSSDLAKQQSQEAAALARALGLTVKVGCITSENPDTMTTGYDADIVYASFSEDIIKSREAELLRKGERCLGDTKEPRAARTLILDEFDSYFDVSVSSASQLTDNKNVKNSEEFKIFLKALEVAVQGLFPRFWLKSKESQEAFIKKSVQKSLSSSPDEKLGLWTRFVSFLKKIIGIKPWYKPMQDDKSKGFLKELSPMDWQMWIESSFSALTLVKKRDYVIALNTDGRSEVNIVHHATSGDRDVHSTWGQGIHQIIAAREGVYIPPLSKVVSQGEVVSHIKGYKHVLGLTGTVGAKLERDRLLEMMSSNGKEKILKIPRHKANLRFDFKPVVYANQRDQWNAVLTILKYNRGEPSKINISHDGLTKQGKTSKINIPHDDGLTKQKEIMKKIESLRSQRDHSEELLLEDETQYALAETYPIEEAENLVSEQIKNLERELHIAGFGKVTSDPTKPLYNAAGASRSTLLVFETMEEVDSFYQFLQSKGMANDVFIYDDAPLDLKASKDLRPNHQDLKKISSQLGAITLTTAKGGRGMDYDMVDHVIVMKPGISRRIPDQNGGRSGRNGNLGLSQMILNKEDLSLNEKKVKLGFLGYLKKIFRIRTAKKHVTTTDISTDFLNNIYDKSVTSRVEQSRAKEEKGVYLRRLENLFVESQKDSNDNKKLDDNVPFFAEEYTKVLSWLNESDRSAVRFKQEAEQKIENGWEAFKQKSLQI